MPTIPQPKALPASVRSEMSKGVPMHKAMAGAKASATGPRVKVGK